jgi:hypothetical protein
MRKSIFLGLIISVGLINLSSCKKDETTTPTDDTSNLKTGEVILSSAQMYKDDWVYFSFETGAEVDGIDSTNYNQSADWDIAFHSRLGRTNGGASGNNKGAIYFSGSNDFNAVKDVNTDNFIQDSSVNLIVGIGNRGPIYKPVSGNVVFDNAFSVDYSKHPPLYTPLNNVYVIKTANGKYAKIQITGYFDDKGNSGHINFKYAYQPDGTTILE